MFLNKTIYCISTALKNFKQNLLYNLITATTIAITFIIFVSFLLIVLNLSVFKKNWVDRLQIIFYFSETATSKNIEEAKAFIAGLEEVETATFVSSAEALRILRSSLKGQDGILEGLTKNPLPPSLDIKLKREHLTVEGVEQFIQKIETNEYCDDIEYGQKWLDRFITLFDILKIIGFSFGGLLFLFTLFIISNTIKLMIYGRCDEIEIMRLVGATNRFIKLPFCIEGIMQGVLGSALSLLFIYLTVNLLMNTLIASLQFYLGSGNFIFLDVTITAYVLLLGAVLGLAGSLLSLNSIEEFHT